MQTQVKPGTRCECEELHPTHYRDRNINGPPLKACPNDAVRLVTVPIAEWNEKARTA